MFGTDVSSVLEAALSEGEAPEVAEGGDQSQVTEAQAQSEGGAPEEPGPEGDEQEQEEQKQGATGDGDPFSEKALSTPEGIAKARELIVERERKTHETYLRLQRREVRARQQAEELKRDKESVVAVSQRILSDVNILRTGSPKEVVEALGRITGRDGAKVFEELSLHVATNGKARKEAPPEVAELRAELERLKEEQRQELLRLQKEQYDRELQAAKDRLVRIGQNETAYPTVAHFTKLRPAEVADYLIRIKTEAYESGSPITDEAAVARLEEELRLNLRANAPAPKQGAAPSAGGEAGLDTSAAQPAKPGSGGMPGQTLAPSLTTQGGSTREQTWEERRKRLANDPEFIGQLGIL